MTNTMNFDGYVLSENNNINDLLETLGLNYKVNMTPVRYNVGDEKYVDTSHWVTYKENDPSYCFGVVGSAYTIMQNESAFGFLEEVNGLTITKGGETLKGQPYIEGQYKGFDIKGEHFTPVITFATSHDGSLSFIASFQAVRGKTGTRINAYGTDYEFRFKHTPNVSMRKNIADALLAEVDKGMDSYQKQLESFSDKVVSKTMAQAILEKVAESKNKTGKNSRTYQKDLTDLQNQYSRNEDGTALGIYFAVAEYIYNDQPKTARGDKKSDWYFNNAIVNTPNLLKKVVALLQAL